MNIQLIGVGSDPEFFIINENKELVPSTLVIPGTKRTPYDMGEGYQVLRDNVLVEMNVPVAHSKEEFISIMTKAKQIIQDNFLTKNEYTLLEADSGEFQPEDLDHPEAKEFGCEPFLNVWSGEMETILASSMDNRRVAGGHIHIGYEVDVDLPKELLNMVIAKAFDVFLMIPARLHFNDEYRNNNYGVLGAIRNKPYGLEIRSLGGHFLQDKYLPWIYQQIERVFEYVNHSENIGILNSLSLEDLDKLRIDPIGFEEVLNIKLEDQLFKEEHILC